MKRACSTVMTTLLAIGATGCGVASVASLPPTPVAHWSLEAQRAIVPPPAGIGNKFPGEAAVYMGIVHVAMHDVAVAIQGGSRPYAIAVTAPTDASPAAAIAAAAHGVLVALLPTQRRDLDDRYAEYVSKRPRVRPAASAGSRRL